MQINMNVFNTKKGKKIENKSILMNKQVMNNAQCLSKIQTLKGPSPSVSDSGPDGKGSIGLSVVSVACDDFALFFLLLLPLELWRLRPLRPFFFPNLFLGQSDGDYHKSHSRNKSIHNDKQISLTNFKTQYSIIKRILLSNYYNFFSSEKFVFSQIICSTHHFSNFHQCIFLNSYKLCATGINQFVSTNKEFSP